MKFKQSMRNLECEEIQIEDHSGDTLKVETSIAEDGVLFFFINDSVGVRVSRKKALKLAFAIIKKLF